MKVIHLTDKQYDDLMWAAHQGLEQVFEYTDPEVDWAMTDDEFEDWQLRVVRAYDAAGAAE